MEFLDPKKQKQHHIYLMICYALMTIGLVLATIILLALAYGFGFDRKGQVTQSGLIFVSSNPSGADVYIDNEKLDNKTNTRQLLLEGRYTLKVAKTGYTDWQRSIIVNGSVVERFDYPLLVPKELKTTTTKVFDGAVNFASQSRDRQWLLVGQPTAVNQFALYDLNDKAQPSSNVDVPQGILTDPTTTQLWEQVEWSKNNRHVLLKRTFISSQSAQAASEYILFDREVPAESVNISTTFLTGSVDTRLIDGEYDQYYFLNPASQRLTKATLEDKSQVTVLNGVVDYKSYEKNKILYIASSLETEKESAVRLKDGDKIYKIDTVPARGTYLLDIAQHDGDWYIAVGEQSENRVAVYKNPIESLRQLPTDPLVPVQVLKVQKPVYVAFSANTRFIMATSGQNFYTYDIKNDKGYQYTASQPVDSPQKSAKWMDGYRLTYVSNGKVIFFDYDYTNQRTLQAASPSFIPFFDRDYENINSLVSQQSTTSQPFSVLQNTPLRIPADQ